jgi:hypothetical protein
LGEIEIAPPGALMCNALMARTGHDVYRTGGTA